MSDASTSTGASGKIEFIDNHRPALPSGDYEIKVSQSIKASKEVLEKPSGQDTAAKAKKSFVLETFESQTRKFAVQGPRFNLEPQVIRAVFPPAGSLGEHSSVFPHISFNRSTLPWERFAIPLTEGERLALETRAKQRSEEQKSLADTPKLRIPWLALLVFDQDELVEKETAEVANPAIKNEQGAVQANKSIVVEGELTAGKVSGPKGCTLFQAGDNWTLAPDARASTPDNLLSPTFPHESGQQEGDPVTTIDVARDLLEDILPSLDDVELLAHVRQPTDDAGTPAGDQVATILANRLPQAGQMSVIHLVSLEGRYGSEDRDLWNLPEDGQFVRLISLKSWRFTCLDEKHSFKGLLHHLNKEHLFSIDPQLVESLPVTMEETPLSQELRDMFLSHDCSISKETTARLERHAWIIKEKDAHQRLLIRREDATRLGVYENQKRLAKFDLPADQSEEAIEKAIRDNVAAVRPLLCDVALERQPAEAWRIVDPQGSDYMIRRNGKQYGVHQILPHSLRLPSMHLNLARNFVEQGLVPIPHEMRHGNRSVSWYRGPLAPGRVDNAVEDEQALSAGNLPARSADQLMRYNPANGMFDVSYATAWELGRLLTLQNEKVAVSLLDWKRRHRHSQERQRAMGELEHLPIVGRLGTPDLPADVTKWFADLALLLGVPFNYLVPDERMLPQESIRFFWVDSDWIRRLHDGAFSIGRVLPSDHARDAAHDPDRLPQPHAIVTGFLLRSEVVSGWPDLQVDGYHEAVAHENYEHDTLAPPSPLIEQIPCNRWLQEAMNNGDVSALFSAFGFSATDVINLSSIVANSSWLVNVNENESLYRVDKKNDELWLSIENKLPMLRMERLSPNVLLCMFAGNIKTVDIHQKPEALHFGLDRPDDASGSYFKELKSHIGGELPGCNVHEIPWRNRDGTNHRENSKRVIAIGEFNRAIQAELKRFQLEGDVAKNSMGGDGITEFAKMFKQPDECGTSAQFALQVTEGVQKVRFVVSERE